MTFADADAIAGFVALFNSLVLVPSVHALRKIAARHDDKLENHETRIQGLEHRRPRKVKRKLRRRW